MYRYIASYNEVKMLKKRDTCLYCEEKMQQGTARKKFCSSNCRSYYNSKKNNASKKVTTDLPAGYFIPIDVLEKFKLPLN
jgi:hypothetical protein